MIDIDQLNLEEPIAETDDFLLQLSIKYKLSGLLTSSIMLARLMHLNNQCGSMDDFRKLLSSVADGIDNKEFKVPDQGNMH
jgi:hypothetical protein